MEEFRSSVLQRQAGERLRNVAGNPKKLVLIHTSVALGIALLITVLNFFLSRQIAGTGGLAGLGIRSVLTTVQSVLEFIGTLALPFWEIGIVFLALCWARGETVEVGGLFQGFRRIGSVLGMRLLFGGLLLVLSIAVGYISVSIFMVTPYARPLLEMMESLPQGLNSAQQAEALLTDAYVSTVTDRLTPLFVLFCVLYLLVAIPAFYRLRFAEFALMDGAGALGAIGQSFQMTRRNWIKLVKLDLHFWWFYLLQVLCVVLCYGDVILPLVGIQLPVSADWEFFLFYLLGVTCQAILFWQFRGLVTTTYGMAYATLCPQPIICAEQIPPNTTLDA